MTYLLKMWVYLHIFYYVMVWFRLYVQIIFRSPAKITVGTIVRLLRRDKEKEKTEKEKSVWVASPTRNVHVIFMKESN